jgi:hypothetical protein
MPSFVEKTLWVQAGLMHGIEKQKRVLGTFLTLPPCWTGRGLSRKKVGPPRKYLGHQKPLFDFYLTGLAVAPVTRCDLLHGHFNKRLGEHRDEAIQVLTEHPNGLRNVTLPRVANAILASETNRRSEDTREPPGEEAHQFQHAI